MKTATFLILASTLLILASCQKRYCWQCTTKTGSAEQLRTQKIEEVCDETEKDIKTYELANTYVSNGGDDSLIYTSTKCTRN